MTEQIQLQGQADPATTRATGEETIELQLTAEEQRLLQQADEQRLATEDPGDDSFILKRSRRIDRMGTVTFAVLVVAITALTGWRALISDSAPQRVARAAPAAAVAPVAAPVPQTPEAGVKVANPFDAAEVFEFPANTTRSEADSAIAALLLQRARERNEQGLVQRRGEGRHPLHMVAADPLNVFVTKLPRPAAGPDATASLRAETALPE